MIYFAQTNMENWKATHDSGARVAWITQLDGEVGEVGKYKITYYRTTFANKRNPAKTTRFVNSNLDTIQARIQDRAW